MAKFAFVNDCLWTVLLALGIAACASTSRVVPIGQGNYIVSSAPDAVVEANSFCAGMGKRMVVQNRNQQGAGSQEGMTRTASSTVQFTCE
jgi:hypothetical protein